MPFMASNSLRANGNSSQKKFQPNERRVDGNRDSQFVNRKQKILQQRKSLPIASVERRIVEEVKKNDTLIIVGETGSGKTTQLPQFLYNGGLVEDGKLIGITQPRRVAAVTVAKRVAEECGVLLGQKVGYSIRFDDMTSSLTKIKFMTDGLLLREALLDPLLSKYSIIIVDEAHERTVHTDVLLGLLKTVQASRAISVNQSKNIARAVLDKNTSDEEEKQCFSPLKLCQGGRMSMLKLIITSASLDARGFSEFFGRAKVVHIKGRQFSVDVLYTLKPETDYLDAALVTIFQVHLDERDGDILVFLTGQEEIESLERLIQENVLKLAEDKQNMMILPIYSSLPSEQQMLVFKPAPPGIRKVVLATNIAETSLTIPGIKYVIDTGVVKARSYDAVSGIESLIIIPISKAQAIQRSGRAGREGPGKCFRLYQEIEFEKLIDAAVPEIKRCNLSSIVLQLKALGIEDIIGFDFMEKPSGTAIVKALEQLSLLGALTDDGKLSDPVGRKMAQLPLDPIYAKALIKAGEFNCLEEMLIVVAMLSVESIFYGPLERLEVARAARTSFSSPGSEDEGDHITFINVFRGAINFLEGSKTSGLKEKNTERSLNKWCKKNFLNYRSLRHARDIHSQIHRQVASMGLQLSSCGEDMLQFRRCLAASFFLNVAIKQPDGFYRSMAGGQKVQIHPSSILFGKKPECVVFNELVQTSNNYVRNVTRIDSMWLSELAPQYFCSQT